MTTLQRSLLMTICLGIGQLGKLRVLELEENLLESIPNEVGRLRELNRLILQSNKLTQLPRAIGRKILTHTNDLLISSCLQAN